MLLINVNGNEGSGEEKSLQGDEGKSSECLELLRGGDRVGRKVIAELGNT